MHYIHTHGMARPKLHGDVNVWNGRIPSFLQEHGLDQGRDKEPVCVERESEWVNVCNRMRTDIKTESNGKCVDNFRVEEGPTRKS